MAIFHVALHTCSSLGVELNPVNVREAGEIERAVAAFARTSNDGLIVTGGGLRHRDLIITLAARTNCSRPMSNATLSPPAA